MVVTWPNSARVSGFGSKPYVMVLGLGLCTLPVHDASGQERGKLLAPIAAQPRISVASSVAQGCGATIPPSVIQQDAEAQLRGVGITVSSIHNAQLAIDVYCAPVTPGSRKTAVVIRECLDFSEVVPAPANHARPTSATTFRNCQSLVCRGAKCEPLVRSGLHTLINPFLRDFRDRNSRNDSPIAQIRPQPQASVIPREAPPRIEGQSAFYVLYVFYLLYIMTCVTVFVYWQCRGHQYRL
jgi:hypothetical protein